ncbi:MAG: 30S ribosomal protein S20 [Acidobacteria bacterium RBG_16_68_9]|nr:MAG: 30S ribosomal protein S20 [Acidobacteria bacterium RBG_16_68_9]
MKRNRQNLKQRERNRAIRARVRAEVRKAREAVQRQDAPTAEAQLRAAMQGLSKAASKGVLHKNAAARRIARLSRQVAALAPRQQ